jgi:uncharacterized protein YecE (DUF72 family)
MVKRSSGLDLAAARAAMPRPTAAANPPPSPRDLRLGTAGWSIPREVAERFPGEGRHLARYARVLRGAEINSSFHREHRPEQYARWAEEVPDGFRFSVKLPRTITHQAKLRDVDELLDRFLEQAGALGDRLGVLLVQLPPSLAYDPAVATPFLDGLRSRTEGLAIACEPRHPSWFEAAADADLAAHRVARVAADPARVPQAATPGGWLGESGDGRGALLYWRWHGAPRMYWSRYEPDWVEARAREVAAWPNATEAWCIFDNTAGSGALPNVLELGEALGEAVGEARAA